MMVVKLCDVNGDSVHKVIVKSYLSCHKAMHLSVYTMVYVIIGDVGHLMSFCCLFDS